MFRPQPIGSLQGLLDVHEIQQLKYRYVRAIDTRDWDVMDSCFADDARVWYMDGAISRAGRDSIVSFFRDGIGEHHYSSHIAVHPEISLTSDATAQGIWRFEDTVFTVRTDTPDGPRHGLQKGQRVEGAGIYHDEYVKVDGCWLIQSTGFVRLYEYWATPDYPYNQDFAAHVDHALKVSTARGRIVPPAEVARRDRQATASGEMA